MKTLHVFFLIAYFCGSFEQIMSAVTSFPSIVVSMAANEGFQFKMIAVVERLRAMPAAKLSSTRIIGYDL